MTSKIKNILKVAVIIVVIILIYIFFIKQAPEDKTSLVSSANTLIPATITDTGKVSLAEDFLSVLLNVKNIKLNDTIFSDKAFNALLDSSIFLTPDGNEGRPNPFAPLGTDATTSPLTP